MSAELRKMLPVWQAGASDVWVYRRAWKPQPADFWNIDQTTGILLKGAAPDCWANTADIKQVWKLSCCNHFPHRALRRLAGLEAGGRGSAAGDILEWKRATIADRRPVHYHCNMIVALRLANWMLALAFDGAAAVQADAAAEREVAAALAEHVNHVAHHLESDGLRTNHYVSNLSALCIAALLYPDWSGSGELLSRAAGRLDRELTRQVDGEGVDYEFSLHYQRLVAELFAYPLFLSEALQRPIFSSRYRERVRSMFEVLETAVNREGFLPQIGDNDSETMWCRALDFGPPRNIRPFLAAGRRLLDGPPPSPLEALVVMTGWPDATRPLAAAAESDGEAWKIYERPGWAFRRIGPFDLVFACGGIGARGYGVHDHVHPNELLVSARGVEFIVDGGTGCYTRDIAVRNRLRSAAGHSTADLGFSGAIPDDRLSGLWRLKQTWKAHLERRGDVLAGVCECGGRRHVREIVAERGRLRVRDCVSGAAAVEMRWLLHPEVRVTELADGAWRLERANARLRLAVAGGQGRRVEADYSDSFSHIGRTVGLSVSVSGPCTTELEIEP